MPLPGLLDGLLPTGPHVGLWQRQATLWPILLARRHADPTNLQAPKGIQATGPLWQQVLLPWWHTAGLDVLGGACRRPVMQSSGDMVVDLPNPPEQTLRVLPFVLRRILDLVQLGRAVVGLGGHPTLPTLFDLCLGLACEPRPSALEVNDAHDLALQSRANHFRAAVRLGEHRLAVVATADSEEKHLPDRGQWLGVPVDGCVGAEGARPDLALLKAGRYRSRGFALRRVLGRQ
mmetsp:Transcript_83222/g.240827  ORF Transcript_83222/g.240827 Transcript_83222/m.240827 type:complete len:233 (-) Transcript_83222:244-942(-)